MKPRYRRLLLFLLAAFVCTVGLRAEEKKTIEFQGTVSAIDLVAKTVTVRAGRKDFVFQIDNQLCNIMKDGRYPFIPGAQSPTLSSARVGDAAVGELVVQGSAATVTTLYLTTKPEAGLHLKGKPGFVTSPYHFISPLSHTSLSEEAIDVRGYRHGTMLVDEVTGKIFLVP